MFHRAVSWTRLSRSLRDNKPKIPAGLLSARALIQFAARRRPLFVSGRYDRAAIMAAACAAAPGIQERCGVSRRDGHVVRSESRLAGCQGRPPRCRSLTA